MLMLFSKKLIYVLLFIYLCLTSLYAMEDSYMELKKIEKKLRFNVTLPVSNGGCLNSSPSTRSLLSILSKYISFSLINVAKIIFSKITTNFIKIKSNTNKNKRINPQKILL